MIGGALGRSLDAAYHENKCATDLDVNFRQKHSYSDDISAFCAEYKKDQLFNHIPGRKHHSFQSHFIFDMSLDDGTKLKTKLIQCSRKLDQKLNCTSYH